MSKRPRKRDRKFIWFLLFLAVLTACFYLFRKGKPARRPHPEPAPPPQHREIPPVATPRSNPPPIKIPLPPPEEKATNPPPIIVAPPPAAKTNKVQAVIPEPIVVKTNTPQGPVETPPTGGGFPRPATNILEAQIALMFHGISAGSIDGKNGGQTASAIRAFQEQQGLNPTGWLDRNTRATLVLEHSPLRSLTIGATDIGALRPFPTTWVAKSELDRLGYQTILEFAAETSASSPTLIKALNPGVDWNNPTAGTVIKVPDGDYPPPQRAASARVNLSGHSLDVFDASGVLQAHFPCSIARLVEKRPVGELHVTVIIKYPNYTFDPAVFPESEEAREIGRKLIIPPGPNNPVGVAWIGLDRPGYGIHGTPNPEEVGRTESHGCFRLANWNAEYLRQMVWPGMPVSVEP